MSNQLGNMIGKIKHVFSITNHAKETVKLSVTFDFTTSSDADIKSWLVSDRTIAFQRPSRMLSVEEVEALDGSTILASDAGKKVKSRAERIAELVNVGLPEALAEMAIDNPASFENAMKSIQPSNE